MGGPQFQQSVRSTTDGARPVLFHRGGIKLVLRRQLWIERIAGIVVLPLKRALRLHMLKCAASAKHQKRIASYRRRHAIPVNVVSIHAEKENGRSSVHL